MAIPMASGKGDEHPGEHHTADESRQIVSYWDNQDRRYCPRRTTSSALARLPASGGSVPPQRRPPLSPRRMRSPPRTPKTGRCSTLASPSIPIGLSIL